METICDYLASIHRCCDNLFLQIETCVAMRDWTQAEKYFQQFDNALRRHLLMEETVLFPAFEKATHNAATPIAMLRMEHQRILGITERIHEALCHCAPVDFVLHSETFTILLQEHGQKEEHMLYPLLDRILSENRNGIVSAMHEAIEAGISA